MYTSERLKQLGNRLGVRSFIFVGAFAAVAVSLLILTRAATPTASVEAEGGTVSGAQVLADSTASGGNSVKFGTTATTASTFITRQGMNLYLNGSQYKFNGANYAAMTAGNCGFTASSAQIDAYFDSLPPRSMTRIWAINNSTSLASLDTVVAKATAHNQYLTIALGDQGGGCDSMVRAAGFYTGGYKDAYFTWVRSVIGRYKDSKAVGIWEALNEGSGSAVTFYNDTAALIKSIDSNHLVSTGAAGFDNSANFVNIHASANIDLVSAHEYDNGSGDSYWATRCRTVAVQLGKPCYVGEYGYLASSAGNASITLGSQTCISFATRASWVKTKTTSYLSHTDVAGAMIWNQDARTLAASDCQISFSAGDSVLAAIRSVTNYPNGGSGGGTPINPTPDPNPVGSGTVNDTSFAYTGTWQASTNASEYNGDDHYSSTAGSKATITFTGTQIKLYTSKAAHHGIATVSLDGGATTNIDEYAAARQDQVLVYTSPTLAGGSHTLSFTVTGTKNASSTGTTVNIDRADITQ